jgi:formylglycine-generating enzyme required for sulfatase activity
MSFDSLPTSARGAILGACEAFECAWRQGPRPRIEDFLDGQDEPARGILLAMLVGREFELRREAGEHPEAHAYRERFGVDPSLLSTAPYDPAPTAPAEPEGDRPTEPDTGPAPPRDATADAQAQTAAAGPPAPAAPEAGGLPERIGRYRVTGYLGRGNFDVFRAYDDVNRREVAIKVAPPDAPERLRLMPLNAEAEVLRALDHPRIVRFYEHVAGSGGGCGYGAGGYLVMQYVEGRTLEALLREGPQPPDRLARTLAQVAEALHHAHTRKPGLIHRDLKPTNVLIDRRGEPYVCDFGLAVDEVNQWDRPGEVAGSFRYMAPEQVRGEVHRLDGRTDLWALGVILYRGLTGATPFPGRTRLEVFAEILHRDPKPPRMHRPDLAPELERICLRCLSRPMSDRYLTAADLAAELRAAVDRPRPAPASEEVRIAPKGLQSFDVEDARFFLAMLPGPRGGDGLPESLRFWKARVEATEADRAFPVGLLFGPSGGGKTSFVRAGLLPRLDRDRVRPVYVAATATGTEARLLAELRRAAPALAADDVRDLPGALSRLRDRPAARPVGKVLLVLDQFEQWLQAHPDGAEAELVLALRHCDGAGVQAIVLVRDDYWMAASRFFQALEVPIVQGRNAAAVELFDAAHARKVLEGFGRALGRVPRDGGDGPAARPLSQFLDAAVAGLTGDQGRVVPVRLSLFAEVVRSRPWTPATLAELGGTDGIGVKFLDDRFGSAPYRDLRAGAQAVLRELLPPPTSAIRGAPRGAAALREALRDAAGPAARPEDFDRLVSALDGELKLITVTDPDGSATEAPPADEDGPGPSAEPHYQLTHDYLVRPIRLWLERDENATRGGRARLRLRLITASWLARPTPRSYPSPLELASILRHVPRREWSADERRLMDAARRHYCSRCLAVAALLLALVLGGRAIQDRRVAASLVDTACVNADFANLRDLVPQLQAYRRLVVPRLERYERPDAPPGTRAGEIATILLYSLAPSPGRGRSMCDLVAAGPDLEELEAIRDALARQPDPDPVVRDRLRALLGDGGAPPAVRLRAACALAALPRAGGGDGGADGAAAALKQALLAEYPQTVPRWIALLGPSASWLVGPLEADSRAPDVAPADRQNAGLALAQVLDGAGRDADLAEAIVAARPDAARPLRLAFLGRPRAPEARERLAAAAARGPAEGDDEPRREEAASRQASAAITMAALGKPEGLWGLLAQDGPDQRVRALLIHTLPGSGFDQARLLDRLRDPAPGPAERQAILMALAEWPPTVASGPLVEVASLHFRDDPDPGVHAAAGLVLRRRAGAEALRPRVGPRRDPARAANGRGWVEGPNGHTLAVLPGPLEFWMGSPEGEADRIDNEARHYRRIGRSIAVATEEVTASQFRRYRPGYYPNSRNGADPEVVANEISWKDAAGYCNWLSRLAGLPACYPDPVEWDDVLDRDVLQRTGYRLPTEAEVEYFCRAGTGTSRPFGESDAFLARYAWTAPHARNRTWPVGRLLPNPFGLFDTLGNVLEWCHDGLTPVLDAEPRVYQEPYPAGTERAPAGDDAEDQPLNWRYLRGSCFEWAPDRARSAFRDEGPIDQPRPRWGFRVVRTLPAGGR